MYIYICYMYMYVQSTFCLRTLVCLSDVSHYLCSAMFYVQPTFCLRRSVCLSDVSQSFKALPNYPFVLLTHFGRRRLCLRLCIHLAIANI